MSHVTLSSQEVSKLANITKRHVQRLLTKGGIIPGARRKDGGHWRIPDSPALRKWADGFEKWEGKPRRDDYEGIPLGTRKAGKKKKVTSPSLPEGQDVELLAKEAVQELENAIGKVRAAMDVVEEKRKMAGQCLLSVRAEKRSMFRLWVRENLRLPVVQAVWLADSVKSEFQLMRDLRVDHRHLVMLGIVDQREMVATKRTSSQVEDIKWADAAANITGWFNKIRITKPLEQWTEAERGAVKLQLKSVVNIYKTL